MLCCRIWRIKMNINVQAVDVWYSSHLRNRFLALNRALNVGAVWNDATQGGGDAIKRREITLAIGSHHQRPSAPFSGGFCWAKCCLADECVFSYASACAAATCCVWPAPSLRDQAALAAGFSSRRISPATASASLRGDRALVNGYTITDKREIAPFWRRLAALSREIVVVVATTALFSRTLNSPKVALA